VGKGERFIMEYRGIIEKLNTNNKDIVEHWMRIRVYLLKIQATLYRTGFDDLFEKSSLNKGFISINDFFNSNKIVNVLSSQEIDNINLYDFLFNIEFYTNLMYVLSKKTIPNTDFSNMMNNYKNIAARAVEAFGYIFEYQNDFFTIVKKSSIELTNKESNELEIDFYKYSNYESLDYKRDCLRKLSNLLEPYSKNRTLQKKHKHLFSYIFEIFNKYKIRHENNEQIMLEDEQYFYLYNLAFNIAISLYDFLNKNQLETNEVKK